MSLNRSPKLLTSWFQRRFFHYFYVSTGANDPQVSGSLGVTVANLSPRGIVGRIYIVNHLYAVLHTSKYRSCVLHGFTQNSKKVFPHYKSMETNDPQGVANLEPRDMAGTIYVGDH